MPGLQAISAVVRRALIDLSTRLEADCDRAHEALRQMLGEIRIEREGEAIYANLTARLDRIIVAAGGPYLVTFQSKKRALVTDEICCIGCAPSAGPLCCLRIRAKRT
jgi:hypothetical protein